MSEFGSKCNCMHCRGGHSHEDFEDDYYEEEIYSFESDEELEVQEVNFEMEEINPEDLIEEFVELVLDEVEDEEQLRDLANQFFIQAMYYGMEQATFSDIEAKVKILDMIQLRKG